MEERQQAVDWEPLLPSRLRQAWPGGSRVRAWRRQRFGIHRRVFSLKQTALLKRRPASSRLHSPIFQEAVILILAATRTTNFKKRRQISGQRDWQSHSLLSQFVHRSFLGAFETESCSSAPVCFSVWLSVHLSPGSNSISAKWISTKFCIGVSYWNLSTRSSFGWKRMTVTGYF
jgi:hypothetical protein